MLSFSLLLSPALSYSSGLYLVRMAFPPYFDTTVFERFELREGDVFVSTTGKSGTTWCCNIVHQLLSNGADFNDINDVVPWIEFKVP